MTRLLTHDLIDQTLDISFIQPAFKAIQTRLRQEHADNYEHLNSLLVALSEFELGRFFIHNQGSLNGRWTYYLIHEYNHVTPANDIEAFLLHRAPFVLATHERSNIFKQRLEAHIQFTNPVCKL